MGTGRFYRHNVFVTSVTQASGTPAHPTLNRPNMVSVGTVVWLSSELMFFAGLFAMYFTLRSTSGGLWAEETAKLNFPFALVNTIVLVSSSFSCQMGVFAAERLQPRRTGGLFAFSKWGMNEWFILTFILGAIFVAGQSTEYAMLTSEHVTLNANAYGSAFYMTTGFHGLHVIGGLVAFLFIIGRAYIAKRFGHFEATSAIVTSYYWHFVDVVWIGLFLVIYVLK
ncbi:cytochrome c oxidase subunit 3 [Psychromicrobium xiongbiense]|uniref:aa3-type cytochrome oxidase subunit III n=1 Tax=Psychromicrobium xiongbiense TaxID=3051184 RepID=UPI002554FC3F|nr:heme-copper oxidase subunit III [Psychromicrobium sp. YIM S02556]